MIEVSAAQVRSFILEQLGDELRAVGLSPADVPDNFDLHESGVIDSFGLIELIGAIEQHFGLEIDFEQLEPDELTVIGPLTEFIAAGGAVRAAASDGD